MSVPLLIALAGCGKQQAVPEGGRVAPEAVGEQKLPKGERGRIKARLADALPAGHSSLHVLKGEEEDGELQYDVEWARPGFSDNRAWFTVRKAGDTVTVSGRGGEWVYEKGKLKKETAAKDASPQQWDWLQKRSGEVAAATYKSSE